MTDLNWPGDEWDDDFEITPTMEEAIDEACRRIALIIQIEDMFHDR